MTWTVIRLSKLLTINSVYVFIRCKLCGQSFLFLVITHIHITSWLFFLNFHSRMLGLNIWSCCVFQHIVWILFELKREILFLFYAWTCIVLHTHTYYYSIYAYKLLGFRISCCFPFTSSFLFQPWFFFSFSHCPSPSPLFLLHPPTIPSSSRGYFFHLHLAFSALLCPTQGESTSFQT